MKRAVVWLIVLACLLPMGGAQAAEKAPNSYEISSFVSASGGGRSATSPYTLHGTVGQATAATSILAGPYDECVGFWCWGWHFQRHVRYLPLVLRGFP